MSEFNGRIGVTEIDGIPVIVVKDSWDLPLEEIYFTRQEAAKFLLISKCHLDRLICENRFGLGDLQLMQGGKSAFKLTDLLPVRNQMIQPKNPKAYYKRLERIKA